MNVSRRAVVDPSGKAWLLELRDTGFWSLRNRFLVSVLLRALGRTPPWDALLLDDGQRVVDRFSSRSYAEAQRWVVERAAAIEAGHG